MQNAAAAQPAQPVLPELRQHADQMHMIVADLEKQLDEMRNIMRKLGALNSDRKNDVAAQAGCGTGVAEVEPNHLTYRLLSGNKRLDAVRFELSELLSDFSRLI